MTHARTVIFVVAPSASGKTMASEALGEILGIPVIKADHVYGELKERFNVPVTSEAITDFEKWEDPRNFGIATWGRHDSIHEAKVECFAELLKPFESSSVIIEGFTLSFALERLIVHTLIGTARSIVIRIELDFERWARQYEGKFGESAADKREVLAYLQSKFERQVGDVVISCTTPEEIHSPPMVDVLRQLI
jgi:hypothetical protein